MRIPALLTRMSRPPKCPGCQRDGILYGFRIGTVGPDRQRPAASSLQLGDDRLRLVLRAGIGEGDGGAISGEPSDDSGTDAARAAGDEGDLGGKGLRHAGFLCFWIDQSRIAHGKVSSELFSSAEASDCHACDTAERLGLGAVSGADFHARQRSAEKRNGVGDIDICCEFSGSCEPQREGSRSPREARGRRCP